MNDQRFFDLAMKVIARQATDIERADLEALLAQEPELRAEFERLETDTRVAKDVLPFITACTASTGEFPAYARERLQTAVRQTLGRPKFGAKEPRRGWQWVLGLAIATAVVLVVALPIFRTPNAPVIQLAILDTVGGTRGARTNVAASLPTSPNLPRASLPTSPNPPRATTPSSRHGADTSEVETLKESWIGFPVQSFSSVGELQAWEKNWPTDGGRPAAKIVYDLAVGEVRVSGRSQGKGFQKTFPVERDLATTLQQAKAFILEQTKR